MLFKAWGLEKKCLVSKPKGFLRTEVKTVTATEEKREAFPALIVHLHRKVQYP
jgi:hypothetical protein